MGSAVIAWPRLLLAALSSTPISTLSGDKLTTAALLPGTIARQAGGPTWRPVFLFSVQGWVGGILA